MASKGLRPLPRITRGALGRCGREGSGALPLARAAAVSTRLRVQAELVARLQVERDRRVGMRLP